MAVPELLGRLGSARMVLSSCRYSGEACGLLQPPVLARGSAEYQQVLHKATLGMQVSWNAHGRPLTEGLVPGLRKAKVAKVFKVGRSAYSYALATFRGSEVL